MYRFFVWALFAAATFSAVAEAGSCSDDEYECANGACVSLEARCDGSPDCPDASDETHALCHNHYCPRNRFRCAYGGCVEGSAACGEYPKCFDNSDKRLLRCRNITAVSDGEFHCENGDKIPVDQLCDGQKHCVDGTDESVRACAGRRCGRGQFQCKYGACVAGRSQCDADRHLDCADGSDEDAVLCNRPRTVVPGNESTCHPPRWPKHGAFAITIGPPPAIPSPTVLLSVTFFVECTPPYRLEVPEEAHCERGQWSAPIPQCKLPPIGSNLCEVPWAPYGGSHTVVGRPNAKPEMRFDSITVKVTCKDGYTLVGPEQLSCYFGHWSGESDCVHFCEIPRHPSVTYYCDKDNGFNQECSAPVESGYYARPKCNEGYHSSSELQDVKCFNNGWMVLQTCELNDNIVSCTNSSHELCARLPGALPDTTHGTNESTVNLCVLPEYPQNGTYSVLGRPNARPGMKFESVLVNVTCNAAMRPDGPTEMHCYNGQWSADKFTSCLYFCELPRDPSVTYYCDNEFREECDDFVKSGTSVFPKCNQFYKSTGNSFLGASLQMKCNYGQWNFVDNCKLDLSSSTNGNSVTIHLGSNLVLSMSGSQYSVVVDHNSHRILNYKVPQPSYPNDDYDYNY